MNKLLEGTGIFMDEGTVCGDQGQVKVLLFGLGKKLTTRFVYVLQRGVIGVLTGLTRTLS